MAIRFGCALAAILTAAMVLVTIPCSAFGVVSGVSGRVTVGGVTPIPGATVTLLDADYNTAGETTTGTNGDYSFAGTGLTVGAEYTVWVDAHGYESAESPVFTWNGSSSIQNFQLTALTLVASGTITDSGTGDPVAGAEVYALVWISEDEVYPIGGATTAADGSYAIYDEFASGLTSGDYIALEIWADGYQAVYASGTTGGTYSGSPLTLNATLDPAPVAATGTVTDADTGLPIEGAWVNAWVWESGDYSEMVGVAVTDENGEFTVYDELAILEAGDYVGFDVEADGYEVFTATGTNGATYTGSPIAFDVALDPLVEVTLEDSAAGVTFDRFVPSLGSAFSNGSYVYGRWTGTRIEARFVGSSIAWIGPMQPNYGKADVYIDGTKVETVDCYAPAASATLSTTLFESGELGLGTHTISIRLTGAKNAASSGNIVVVDNFQVTTAGDAVAYSRANETAGTFSGAWVNCASATYTDTTYRYSRWAGAKVRYTFTGTKVAWIGPKALNYGRAEVYIDGVRKTTLSQYGVLGWRYRVWESATLAAGTHTIEIRVLGTKDAASSGTIVVVDGFDVTP